MRRRLSLAEKLAVLRESNSHRGWLPRIDPQLSPGRKKTRGPILVSAMTPACQRPSSRNPLTRSLRRLFRRNVDGLSQLGEFLVGGAFLVERLLQ
jgi:hypothetical protein